MIFFYNFSFKNKKSLGIITNMENARVRQSTFSKKFTITVNKYVRALSCIESQEFFEFLLNLKKCSNFVSKFYC